MILQYLHCRDITLYEAVLPWFNDLEMSHINLSHFLAYYQNSKDSKHFVQLLILLLRDYFTKNFYNI